MKIVLVIVLVIIAVYLYRRTQKTAETELSVSKSESKAKPESNSASDVADVGSEPEGKAIEDSRQEPASSDSEISSVEDKAATEPIPVSPEPTPLSVVETSVVKTPQVKANATMDAEPAKADNAKPASPQSKGSLKPSPLSDSDNASTASGFTPIAGLSGNWASDTFIQLVGVYGEQTEVIAAHKCLEEVIAHCYKLRKQSDYCAYGAKLSDNYLALFKQLKEDPQISVDLKGGAFMQLTTLLNDVEDFAAAIKVCQQAIAYQLDDGTVTGYAGRLARVEKAQLKAQA
ncbi:hypothetical protein [Shewanella sp. SR44-3]|uniref:hypothetical protein n=1 Tax=Shewanella sp. SR44-3 TaxID=2760936 RepID=UPI0015F992B4|nr:hypothetical protein [Shewanella sp. SR44-3]MBB1269375.1 hypothetical protein [Shewanella sp. SR44-3]